MSKKIPSKLYFRSFFSPEDCKKLIDISNQKNSSPVSLWTDEDLPIFDDKKRSGMTTSISTTDLLKLELKSDLLALIKKLKYKFQLPAKSSSTSFQIYEYKPGDHFSLWHVDDNPQYLDTKRTLTMICLLSLPSSFRGGRLMLNQSNPIDADLKQGDIIFFSSHQTHRVTEIIKGLRHTLVCWI